MTANRDRASDHNERGRELEERGQTDQASREYLSACEIDPTWSVPHYNLGLLYKYAGDWEKSLHWNQRAAALNPRDQAGWWNLAIAATALGRWDQARRAWRRAGVNVPDGDGPVDYECGRTPIRLNPNGSAEVVWSRRLDPARALLESVPLPESGFRWRDIVLNDGAPNGYRMLGRKEVPVFDCLQLLSASSYSTFIATVDGSEQAADALAELAAERELGAEEWSNSVRRLCKACSEGRPHGRHDHGPRPEAGPRRVGLAARRIEDVERLLADWRVEWPSIRLLSIEAALDAS